MAHPLRPRARGRGLAALVTLVPLVACGGGGGGSGAPGAGAGATTVDADLTGGSLTVLETHVEAGQEVTVSLTALNLGPAAAPAFRLAVYLSSDELWDGADVRLGFWTVAGLAAGASVQEGGTLVVPTSTPAGVVRLLLVVDDLNEVLEPDETNNVAVAPGALTVDPPLLPDLEPTAVSFAPFSVGAGATVEVSDDVRNAGVASTGSFRVGVYLSLDATVTTNDVLIGHRTVLDLAPGASEPASGQLTVPAALSPGNYHLGVIADDEDVVLEANEGDNVLTAGALLQVTAPLAPDLVPASMGFTPSAVDVGQPIFVEESVRNEGSVAAGTFQVGVFLSTDPDIDPTSDTLLGFRTVAALPSGGVSASGTVGLTVPSTVPAGNYFVGLYADHTELQPETSETNNATLAVGQLAVTVPPLADLVAHAVSFSPATLDPTAGGTLTVDQEVRNIGAGDAGPFRVSVYLSENSVVSTSDVRLGSRTLSSLAIGGGSGVSAAYPLPAGLATGSYYVGLLVDDLGEVLELSEANNLLLAAGQLDVTSAPSPEPNLVVNLVDPSASAAQPGGTFQIVTRIENQGTASAASEFWVAVYLSLDATIAIDDILLGERRVPFGLGIGFTSVASYPVTVPPGTPVGTYRVGAIVDSRQQIAESDETDNALAAPGNFSVFVPPPPMPNLVVSSMDVPNLGPFAAGDSFDVDHEVQNTGEESAGPFRVGIYLSADATLDITTDTLIASRVVQGLAVQATDSLVMSVTIPIGTATGDWRVGVFVDDLEAVTEELENDNGFVFTGGPLLVQ